MLIIDEVSMLGTRTLYAVNERLRMFRGCAEDFGGIAIVLLCGDFHQFSPCIKEINPVIQHCPSMGGRENI
jgi:hypothetical protein